MIDKVLQQRHLFHNIVILEFHFDYSKDKDIPFMDSFLFIFYLLEFSYFRRNVIHLNISRAICYGFIFNLP